MYNDQLVYKVVIWAYFGISLWKENVALCWDGYTWVAQDNISSPGNNNIVAFL